MEFHQLRYFCAVVRNGTFTRAAESEHVSQPSLSQQIQKLEDELNARLFERLPRQARLTSFGSAFFPKAQAILRQAGEACTEIQDMAALTRSQVQWRPSGGTMAIHVVGHSIMEKRSSAVARNPQFVGATLAPAASSDKDDFQGHSVQFYQEDDFFLDAASRFIGAALVAGDVGIVLATHAHREGLAQRLVARGLDLSFFTTRGRLVRLDAAETLAKFMIDGWPNQERFNRVIGGSIVRARASAHSKQTRVAAFGEMAALLWADGKTEAAIRLEQLWNNLARTHTFHLRCAYPISFFADEQHGVSIQKVCAEHIRQIPTESYTSLLSQKKRLAYIISLQQKAQAYEMLVMENARLCHEAQQGNRTTETA